LSHSTTHKEQNKQSYTLIEPIVQQYAKQAAKEHSAICRKAELNQTAQDLQEQPALTTHDLLP
jgi:hypothetical protein